MNAAEKFRGQVPDEHRCRTCGRTKHDDDAEYGKVNFRQMPKTTRPRLQCYPCEVAQKRNRGVANKGDDRHATPIPPGHSIKGISTRLDSKGAPSAQWIKTEVDREASARLFLDELRQIAKDGFENRAIDPGKPKHAEGDLLCVYPMGDPHIGMYAWGEETGADFDLEIAERNQVATVDRLASLAPSARNGLVISLGDYFHADSPANRTERSGHPLDVDTRWPKVIRTGLRTMIRCIDLALRRHEIVTVICEPGNHDPQSSVWMAMALELYYGAVERVRVDATPQNFHWFRFHQNLIATTHGDKRLSAVDLESIMANDRKEDWGETKHRYWYVGHIHHQTIKETRGCVVESFNTLAARDAHHQKHGYRARRNMKLIVHHREHGEIYRHTVGIEQITGGDS